MGVHWQVVVSAIGAVLVGGSLISVAWSNARLARVQNLNNLQQIMGEMNRLREYRSDHPELERELFAERADWSDEKIRGYLLAVQMANIFEWAFIARKRNLLDQMTWDSWVETWQNVIIPNPALRDQFTDKVWTFGRVEPMRSELMRLITVRSVTGNPIETQDNRQPPVATVQDGPYRLVTGFKR